MWLWISKLPCQPQAVSHRWVFFSHWWSSLYTIHAWKLINRPITWFRYYCHEPHNLAITVTFKYILNICDSMKRVIHVHIDTGKNPNTIHVTILLNIIHIGKSLLVISNRYKYMYLKIMLLRWKFGWCTNIATSNQFVNFPVLIDNWQPKFKMLMKKFQNGQILCNKQSADLDKYLI